MASAEGMPNRFDTVVEDVTYLGNAVALRLAVNGTALRSQLPYVGQHLPEPGAELSVGCEVADLVARPDDGHAR
jgi:hypothetical protein